MPLRYKWTGGWVAPAAGKIAIKWGGTTWIHPSMARVKVGNPGGGSWVDSDYRGYPAVPTGTHVYSWDYNDVRIAWSAGAGGAAVADYHVVQTDSAGNWLRQYTVAGGVSPSIPVSVSSYYIFYVRSRSSAGLYSDWGPVVRAKIGKPAETYYTTETADRAWSAAASVGGYKDAIVGVAVPSNVVVQSVRYQISSQGGFTSVLSPYNNREIYRIANSGQQERFSWGNPVDAGINVTDYWGNGGITGMICRGAGWSTAASGTYKAIGTITASGYERYNYQQAHTIPAVANGYW